MLHLLLTPMVLQFGATGEVRSCCTRVQAWIFVALQVMLLLPFCFKDARCVVWVLWIVAGWICLGLPSEAGTVNGELRS